MPKKERNIAREQVQTHQEKTEAEFGALGSDIQGQIPGARETAEGSLVAAREAATGLSSGAANPYATRLAEGEANPYATNLALTGGISPEEAQRMETSATRGVRSVYDILGAEARRKQAITGGYGGAGEISQMARQVGQKQAESITDAQARIAGMRQEGRVSGAGMVGQQQIAGAGMVGDLANAGAQLLTTQYGMSQDQANAYMTQLIQTLSTGGQLSQGDIQIMEALSRQKGTFGAIAEGIGQVGGAVGSVITGIKGKT